MKKNQIKVSRQKYSITDEKQKQFYDFFLIENYSNEHYYLIDVFIGSYQLKS